MRSAPGSIIDRRVIAAVDACAVIGLASAGRLMYSYWWRTGALFLRARSSVWVALARDAAHGELYRPVLGAAGYGGTRYMPLLFVSHGLLMRAGVDPILGGVVLMQATVAAAAVALFIALRKFALPARVAAPLAAVVWSSVIFQQSCTDLGPDYLAAALVLGAGVAAADAGAARPRIAAVLFVLAALTKITAAAFVVPIAIGLWLDGQRRDAAILSGASIALLAVSLTLVDVISAGHFHQTFLAAAAAGVTPATIVSAAPKFLHELAIKPFDVAGPFAVAIWCAWRSRLRSWAHWYLAAAAAVAVVIFASPGTASNHLVDLQVAATLVIGLALARGELQASLATATYGAAAAMLLLIAVPIPGVPSVVTEVRNAGPRPRASALAIHAAFVTGQPYLSMDPIVPILNGDRPWVLDYASLERFVASGTAAGRDVVDRLEAGFFGAIVLPDMGVFNRDMDRGDSGFARAEQDYWRDYDSPLAPLFRRTYAIAAARRPFVVLVPRRHPDDAESPASVFTAVALAGAAVGPDGVAVRSEAALGLDAPVRGRVVAVVKGELVGVRTRRDEHPLVADVQAVHAGRQLGRSQMVHTITPS